jgi:2-Cys peroxiredoxin 5
MSSIVNKIKGAKPLAQGSKLPTVGLLKEKNPEQGTVDLAALSGKIIIVGVPGAFTPPCSSQVPGYVEKAEQFAAKGVTGIYIVAVNDAFTTQAWAEKNGWNHPLVHILADDKAEVSILGVPSTPDSTLIDAHHSSPAPLVSNSMPLDSWATTDPSDMLPSSNPAW